MFSLTLVGHISLGGVMFTPSVCWLLAAQSRRFCLWKTGAAGLAMGFLAVWSLAHLVLLTAIGVTLLLFLHSAATRRLPSIRALTASAAIGGGIAASKAVAGFALLCNITRDFYGQPGAATLWDNVVLLANGMFARSLPGMGSVTAGLTVGQHELEFSIGPGAGLLLAVGLLTLARRRPGLSGRWPWLLLALGLVLLIWLCNWDHPWVRSITKALPVLRHYSLPCRLWAAFCCPLALLSGLALDWTMTRQHTRWWVAVIVGICSVAWMSMLDTRYYLGLNAWYDPQRVVRAAALSRATQSTPSIQRIAPLHTPERRNAFNDGLVYGSSAYPCQYNLFGYDLEKFPAGGLVFGSPWREQSNVFNFKNPACYVFPAENGCQPGDHFRVDQRAELELFLQRKPFPFAMPARQRIADAVSLVSLLAALLLVAVGAAHIRRNRVSHRPTAGDCGACVDGVVPAVRTNDTPIGPATSNQHRRSSLQ
jgi:hypothetical protein